MHGQPDHGAYAAKKTVASMADNAELAARLGSIVTFDRRGDVILLDDFEDNINKWDISLDGVGGSITLSNDTAKNGGSSAKIVTGNLAGNESSMYRSISKAVDSRIGLELSHTTSNAVGAHQFILVTNVGTDFVYGGIQYDPVLEILYYMNTLGAYVPFAPNTYTYQLPQHFHQIKLVIDLATGYYVKLLFGNTEYDLSAYQLYTTGGFNWNWLVARYIVSSRLNAPSTTYMDDLILTQNEP